MNTKTSSSKASSEKGLTDEKLKPKKKLLPIL